MPDLLYKRIVRIALILIFPASCIIDLHNGISNNFEDKSSMFAQLYKGVIMVVCLIACAVEGIKVRQVQRIFALVLLFCLCLCHWSISCHYLNIASEMRFALKVVYPWIILFFLCGHSQFIDISDFIKILYGYGVIAALSLIIWVIFLGDFSLLTSTGMKGAFTGGNDLGLCLLITGCITGYLYTEYRKFIYFLVFIIVLISSVIVGTIAGIGGALAILILFLINLVFLDRSKYSDNKNKYSGLTRAILIIFSFSIIAMTAIHIDNLLNENMYMMRKVNNIVEGNGAREGLQKSAERVLSEFNVSDWLLGRGYTDFSTRVGNYSHDLRYRLTEMDFHDIVGYYGILLGGGIILFSFYVFLRAFKGFIYNKMNLYYWSSVATALFIGHGYFAGHAYMSPSSSLLFVGVAFIVLCNKNECHIK